MLAVIAPHGRTMLVAYNHIEAVLIKQCKSDRRRLPVHFLTEQDSSCVGTVSWHANDKHSQSSRVEKEDSFEFKGRELQIYCSS